MVAFNVYYGAVLLRNGAIKTSIEAERTPYEALLNLKEEAYRAGYIAVGVYSADPKLLMFDGDQSQASTLTEVIKATYFKGTEDDAPPTTPAGAPLSGTLYKGIPRTSIKTFTKRTTEGATNATA